MITLLGFGMILTFMGLIMARRLTVGELSIDTLTLSSRLLAPCERFEISGPLGPRGPLSPAS